MPKYTLPKFSDRSNKLLHETDRELLLYEWKQSTYESQIVTDDLDNVPFGDNDSSNIYAGNVITKPRILFTTSPIVTTVDFPQSIMGKGLGTDAIDLGVRLGDALVKKAFSYHATRPFGSIPAVGFEVHDSVSPDWFLGTLIPKGPLDPFITYKDSSTFKGGHFIAIIDTIRSYANFNDTDPDQYDADLAALIPFISKFESFHVLMLVDDWDSHQLALRDLYPSTDPPSVAIVEAQYDVVLGISQPDIIDKCASLASMGYGFETIDSDYTTILNRIKEIWGI